jgi:serine/threonine-protein kinase
MNTVLQVLEGEPAAMRGSTGRIPRALEAICKKCLQRRPQDRYSTAAALADDLDRFLRREPILAAPPTPFERLARWARTETALAMRLGVLAAVAVIMQAGHHFAGRGWNYHLGIKIVMACWAGVAFVLQRCVNRPDWARHSRLAWILTDSAFLTTCLALAEGEIGPLLSGYSVLIVASGLWLQGRLVMFGTATNLVSFALLLWLKPQLSETAHYPGIFAAALAAIGTITAFQVRRLRILARHLEPSPSLPRRS